MKLYTTLKINAELVNLIDQLDLNIVLFVINVLQDMIIIVFGYKDVLVKIIISTF